MKPHPKFFCQEERLWAWWVRLWKAKCPLKGTVGVFVLHFDAYEEIALL